MNVVKSSFFSVLVFFATFVFGQNQRLDFEDSASVKPFVSYSDVVYKKVVFGFQSRGIVLFGKDSTRLKRQNASVLRWEPYCAYFPIRNLGFGVFGVVEHFQSNYILVDVPTVYEYGFFTRYFIPFTFNKDSFLNRISISIGLSFSKSNYVMKSKYYYFGSADNYLVLPKMTQSVLRIPVNLHVRIIRELNAVLTFRYENFFDSYAGFSPMIGLEYKL